MEEDRPVARLTDEMAPFPEETDEPVITPCACHRAASATRFAGSPDRPAGHAETRPLREPLTHWRVSGAGLRRLARMIRRLILLAPLWILVATDSLSAPRLLDDKRLPALTPEKDKPARFARISTRPVIDGRINDEAWKQATVLKDFYQIEPGDNTAASQPTEVLLGHDSTTIYIAFRAYDEPGRVRATVARRDNIFDDDYVGMFLDTFNDQRRAYALFFNPLGIQADGVLTENGGEDYSIDIVMESKGVVSDDGYTVEIAIPLKSLRYEAGKDKKWGAHFFRRIKRFDNELDSWMPFSRDRSGTLNQAGKLSGLEEIDVERTLDLIPSMTVSQTTDRVRTFSEAAAAADPARIDPGRFLNRPADLQPGLTMKLGVTPAVALDVALNPDFAQIEADQPVVTANQRFPIFFEEKRPFFFEGIDIFRTPIQAVHTRAIVDPDWAVKLTGKRGRNSFGVLLASDNAPGNFSRDERADPDALPEIERFLDKNAYIGVLRIKRDVGRESNVGLIATSYDFVEKHNHLAGIDGRFRLDEKTVLTLQAIGTVSREHFFDADLGESTYRTGTALAYSWSLDMSGRHFGYFASGRGFSADYRADVGFTRRGNTNSTELFVRYSSEPKPKARLISWRLSSFSGIDFDWRGRLQNWIVEPLIRFSFNHQTYFGLAFTRRYERVFEEEFGAKRTATRLGAFFGDDSERSSHKRGYSVMQARTRARRIRPRSSEPTDGASSISISGRALASQG